MSSIIQNEGELTVKLSADNLVNSSETLMYYINNQIKDYNKFAKNDDAPDSLYGDVQLIQGVQRIKFYDRSLLF